MNPLHCSVRLIRIEPEPEQEHASNVDSTLKRYIDFSSSRIEVTN